MSEAKAKKIFIATLILGVIVYGIYSYNKESKIYQQELNLPLVDKISNVVPAASEPVLTQVQEVPEKQINPSKIKVIGDKESQVGDCIKLSFQILDQKRQNLENASFRLSVKDSENTYISLYSQDTCPSQESPSQILEIKKGRSQMDLYAVFLKLGKIKFEATDFDGKNIEFDTLEAPELGVNTKKLKIEVTKSPDKIKDFIVFDIEAEVKDFLGNTYPDKLKEISLYLANNEKSELKDALLLKKNVIRQGKVFFKDILLKNEDMSGTMVYLIVSVDKQNISQVMIPREPFVEKNIAIEMTDSKEVLTGKFLSPSEVEVIGKKYKMVPEGTNLFVMVNGVKYLVEVVDETRLKLIRQ